MSALLKLLDAHEKAAKTPLARWYWVRRISLNMASFSLFSRLQTTHNTREFAKVVAAIGPMGCLISFLYQSDMLLLRFAVRNDGCI